MEADERKKFIISVAARYFCLPNDCTLIDDYGPNNVLNTFLDSSNVKVMSVSLKTDKLFFGEASKLHAQETSAPDRFLIFIKTKPEPITSGNHKANILVMSVNESYLHSLYHSIQDVYAPAILLGNSSEIRPSFASVFKKLEEELRSTLYHTSSASNDVESIDDEVMYWRDIDESAHRRLSGDVRKYLVTSLQYLSTQVKSFSSLSEEEVDDTLENIMNILDDIWKFDFKYPSHRMMNIMAIIGSELVSSLQFKLKDTENWLYPLIPVVSLLKSGMALCEKWSQITQKLTSLYWPHYDSNKWTEEEFIPHYSNGFKTRLEDVLKLRTVLSQLQVVFNDCHKEFNPSRLLKPFEGIKYLLYNHYAEPRWKSAVDVFYASLGTVEPDVVDVIRVKIQAYGSNLTALIIELGRFDALLKLPSVLNILSPERQNFLEQIQHNVSSTIPSSLIDGVKSGSTLHLEMSQLISPIADARMIRNKLGIYTNFANEVLSDLKGYDELMADIRELKLKLKELEDKQFKAWTGKVLSALTTNEYRFATNDPVVSFQSEKLMQVNFSDKLFDLINDTRQLTAYGFVVDQKIVDASSKAKRFLEQAKLLFQVATFHNTMSERIVTSQRPMMLNSARELARLVQTEHSVTWENSREVNEYIKKMQAAVENLANENNRLINYHTSVMKKVEALLQAPISDFIKHAGVWQRAFSEIRSIVDEVGGKYADTIAWRRHIDYQICKILDVKYKTYLTTIDEHLPEVQISLVYRNEKVEYSPSLCVIKKEYFRKVKDSINKLLEIRGFGDNNIFPAIKDKNSDALNAVISSIHDHFIKLHDYSLTWRSWVATSRVNVEFFREHSKPFDIDDWNKNFRASKFFGQQISKLLSSHVIGPFTISLVPLKMSIEWLNRNSWNGLSSMLRSSILVDVDIMNTFISHVNDITQSQAQNAEEFIQYRSAHKSVLRELNTIMEAAVYMDTKTGILRNWAREVVPEAQEAVANLLRAKTTIENYEAVFQQQIDVFRVKVQAQAKEMAKTVRLFLVTWNDEVPRVDVLEQAGSSMSNWKIIINSMKERNEEWIELSKQMDKLRTDFLALDLEEPDFGDYQNAINALNSIMVQWTLMDDFLEGHELLGQIEWVVICDTARQTTETFTHEWKSQLKTKKPSHITERILQEINRIEEFLPHLELFSGDVLSDKHWADILEMLSVFKTKDKLLYGDFLNNKESVIAHAEKIKAIYSQAASEIGIVQALAELDSWEIEAKFSTYEHVSYKGEKTLIIKDVKGILSTIGDYQCLLQSINASSNLTRFADRVNIWESRLDNLDACIQDMIQVQRKWAYLEPIFGRWDLEGIQFDKINREWHNILVQLNNSNFRVATLTRMSNLNSTLQGLLQNLLQCQRALQNFLEGKRLKFPRFYFLNDDDLLEILGQSEKSHVIQNHLKKIFVGVNSVEIEHRGTENVVTTIYSVHGESVPLNQEVKMTPKAEEWLTELSDEIKKTLKSMVLNCKSKADPMAFPAQILCLAERINFTGLCEKAIKDGYNGLTQFQSWLQEQHVSYSKQLLELNSNRTKRSVVHLKLKDLLFDTIYHLNIVKTLIKHDVKSIDDWHWQKNLRFYADSDGSVVVRMVDAQFEYTFEYQGNIPKLVHTSLTDKCYLTLTQASSLGFGGNPYGPAGTGKTESVKALGALFGRQVLVFNCDEGLDADSLMRIMIGIIKSGAWGCFDEFNRLDETTLSLISLQISIIQHALRNNSEMVTLLGREVSLDHNAGIFITLNPAGKGYGGRQKLPENLKQLFRPVLMSKPDVTEITQVILHCEGFSKAEEIGQKIVTLFRQARSLLSHQQHYDWGLRAIKTVVGSCGSSLKDSLGKKGASSQEDEYQIAVNAVRLNTRCKLTSSDAVRFDELIKDIFPKVEFIPPGKDDVKAAIIKAYEHLGLHEDPTQIHKVIELYEQMEQRMGVVIVGPQGAGKTSIIRLLQDAMITMGKTVRKDAFNPKSMSRQQLLGHVDLDTRRWTDGLLTNIAQSVYNEPQDLQCWVHVDGDVDPEWIESLNSVLDDNHLLTLPSGWRIQFGDNVHFIFETHDLRFASPATISRMGIVLLSENDMSYKSCLSKWLLKQPSDSDWKIIETNIPKVMNRLFEEGFFRKSMKSISGVLVRILPFVDGIKTTTHLAVTLAQVLGMMVSESAGSVKTRERICQVIFKVLLEEDGGRKNIMQLYYSEDGSLSYFSNEFEQTKDGLILIPPLLPAIDLIYKIVAKDRSFILVAPAGSGKNVTLTHIFNGIPNLEVISIDCNAYLQPQHVLQRLNQVCMTVTRNSSRIIMPKHSERVIVHLRNIDAIFEDKYGTRILVEFLKQAIERQGFYDEQFEWVGLEKVTFVFTLRYIDTLSSRFLNQLNIVQLRAITIEEQREVVQIWGHKKLTSVDAVPLYNGLFKLLESIRNHVNSDHPSNPFTKYMFTLRELDFLIDNIAHHDLSDKSSLVEAFICEVRRVLKDQIDNFELRSTFENYLEDAVKFSFGLDYGGLLYEDSYFVPKFNQDSPSRSRKTTNEEGGFVKLNEEEWKTEVKNSCVQLGSVFTDHLLLVPDFLDLVAKMEFIMRTPGGSILLPSKAGSGKKTALQIVSVRINATIYTLKVGHGYSVSNFKNDLKVIVQMAGMSGESVIFILEDFQIIDAELLNMVSCLISHGEVFGLYSPEEYEGLSTQLKSSVESEGFEGSTISYLRKRVRENLHLAFMYENDNASISELLRSNPSLSKLCSTIYSNEFSADTMFAIPDEILKKDKGHADMTESRENIANFLATMHSDTKMLIPKTTPLSFFLAIRSYLKFFSEKKSELSVRQCQLQLGVTKISEAQSLVDKLKFEANEQKILLDERQAEGKKVLDQISATMSRANTRKDEMEKLKVDAISKNKTLVARKAEIDEELKSIMPLVEAAQNAVGNIKPEALTEIRSLRVPPKIIRDILEAVLCLMGILDTSWSSMKSFLSGRGIRDEIRFFDAGQITDENRSSVLKILKANKDSFDIKNARRASVAAAPLAAWVQANVKYSIVLAKLRPLNEELAELESHINEAGDQINELETALSSVDDTVAELKEQLSSTTKEAAEIEVRLAIAEKTIAAAEGLVSKLDEEYTVWNKQLTVLSKTMNFLPLNCAISMGFVTYLANVDIDHRAKVVERWKASLDVGGYDSLKDFLMAERDILHWQSEGLPGDEYSLQNATILLNTSMPLLILDPASTAIKWLCNHFQDAKVNTVSIKSSKFVNSLELAVKFGKVLIVSDTDEIHPMLIPPLRQEFIYQGPRKMVYIGNKLVDCDNNFKIFLTTRSLTLKQRAAIPGFIAVVNFSPTVDGLTQQLLSCALRIEKPDMEKRRLELLQEEDQLKNKLFYLQEKVLKELADSQGDILQNQELLSSLKSTKESSDAIKKSLEESAVIKKEMAQECSAYESYAVLGTRIYFACASLSNINNMYHLSVGKYISLFEKSLLMQKKVASMEEKSQNLVVFIYNYISRSLFKDDRLTFSLQLIHAAYADTFNSGEWEYFIGKIPQTEPIAAQMEKLPPWLVREIPKTDEILRLKALCPKLVASLKLEDDGEWMRFLKTANPRLPEHCAITPFQYILVLKALRPDLLHNELYNYSLKKLGLVTLSPVVLKLDTLLTESEASVPILIITSPGTDPSEELRNLASMKKVVEMKEIVLGPGREETTIATLKEASKTGNWVLLKNLHLVTHWLAVLETELQLLVPHSDERFRLWMTTERHPNFPEVLLSASLKISYEAPPGMKNNLLRTYHKWGTSNALHPSREGGRAMFILAWFHALIQERRSYIPQGWTSFYEFNDVDLMVACNILQQIISKGKAGHIQWEFIQGLYEYAVYGGRVNNVFDLRVLSSYLLDFFNDDVLKKTEPFVSDVCLPESGSIEEHLKIIYSLPNENYPEYFGLPLNVEVIRQRVAISKLYEQFKELDKSMILQEVTLGEMGNSVHDLWLHWTRVKEVDVKKLTKVRPEGSVSSLATFFALEVEFSAKLIVDVSAHVNILEESIRQDSFPQKGLLGSALALHRQQVPEEWANIWSGPQNPAVWMEAVIAKTVAVYSLYESTKKDALGSIDLCNVFHGTDFFVALKQDAARIQGVTMENLVLRSSWDARSSDKVSIRITGILLEGALIANNSLEMTHPDSPSVSETPIMTVSWKPEDDSAADAVPIPLYSDESREDVIAELLVTCQKGEEEKWLKAGTAFYIRS